MAGKPRERLDESAAALFVGIPFLYSLGPALALAGALLGGIAGVSRLYPRIEARLR